MLKSVAAISLGVSLVMVASVACAGEQGSRDYVVEDGSFAKDLKFSLGMRYWKADWAAHITTPLTTTPGSSNKTVAGIVQATYPEHWVKSFVLGLKYKDFSLQYAAQPETTFEQDHINGDHYSHVRKEQDVSLAYQFLKGVRAVVGFKDYVNAAGTPSELRWRGPFVGLAASAPLSESSSLYATGAVGKLNKSEGDSSWVAQTEAYREYQNYEAGVAYSFGKLGILDSLVATAGYRIQHVGIQDYNSGTGATPAFTNMTEYSKGLVFGLSTSFGK